jgi:hypothetical protein
MLGYVLRALQRFFVHEFLTRQQNIPPHEWIHSKYGAPVQFAGEPDNRTIKQKPTSHRLQQIIGVFLFYASGPI